MVDFEDIIKYLAFAIAALFVPNFLEKIPQLMDMLMKIPGWDYMFGMVSVGTMVLAGLGIFAVDQLFYNK